MHGNGFVLGGRERGDDGVEVGVVGVVDLGRGSFADRRPIGPAEQDAATTRSTNARLRPISSRSVS